MPSKKISQLAPATTPLAGTELVPIVQNGVTVKVPASEVGALFATPIIIDANGKIGDATSIQYNLSSFFPTVITGPTAIQPKVLANFNLNQNGGFTATYVDVSGPSEFTGFSVNGFSSLTSISCSAEYIGTVNVSSNENLTNISFPNLKTVPYGIDIGYYYLSSSVTYNFPSLEEGFITFGDPSTISEVNNSLFPVLKRSGFGVYDPAITSINLPSLQYFTGLFLSTSPDIYLPNVIECTLASMGLGSPNPSGVFIVGTVGITKKWGDGVNPVYIQMGAAALNQASVDNFLTVLASLDGTNGTTSSDNGYLSIANLNAAPSPAGLAAKTVLEGRGWTVLTN